MMPLLLLPRTWSGLVVSLAALAGTLTASGAAPANDNFANATFLIGTTVVTNGSNVGATRQPREPNHAGDAREPAVGHSELCTLGQISNAECRIPNEDNRERERIRVGRV
jgi:hypothetical protein